MITLLLRFSPGITTTLNKANPHRGAKFRKTAARLLLKDWRDLWGEYNYFNVNDLWTESRTPFTNAPESSEENFFASSTASFNTTLGGVSVELAKKFSSED